MSFDTDAHCDGFNGAHRCTHRTGSIYGKWLLFSVGNGHSGAFSHYCEEHSEHGVQEIRKSLGIPINPPVAFRLDGVGGWSDEQVLLEGGDGHYASHPLKPHKAKAMAEEIVRLRRELKTALTPPENEETP